MRLNTFILIAKSYITFHAINHITKLMLIPTINHFYLLNADKWKSQSSKQSLSSCKNIFRVDSPGLNFFILETIYIMRNREITVREFWLKRINNRKKVFFSLFSYGNDSKYW